MNRSAARVVFILILSFAAYTHATGLQLLIPELDRLRENVADRIGEMLDELAHAKVSGKELAATADRFRKQWRAYMAERKEMASALAVLASEFEKRHRFTEALALYEGLWQHFPEQQELIGKIKRDRALGEVPINLSTPENAFLSFKRALMTYKLNSATFGITDPSQILYADLPPRGKRYWQEQMRLLEKKLTERKRDVQELVEQEPSTSWPEPMLNPWREVTHSLGWGRLRSFQLKNATVLDAVEKLAHASPVPIILSRHARSYLETLSANAGDEAKPVSANLSGAPVHEALEYIVEQACPQDVFDRYASRLRIEEGNFAIRIYDSHRDQFEPFLTMVNQHEPAVPFPD